MKRVEFIDAGLEMNGDLDLASDGRLVSERMRLTFNLLQAMVERDLLLAISKDLLATWAIQPTIAYNEVV